MTGHRSGRFVALAAVGAVALVAGALLLVPRIAGSSEDAGAAALDRYHESDVAFFEHLQPGGGGALEEVYYGSLRDGLEAATTVVVAEVADVRTTRVIVGEVPSDRVTLAGLKIHLVKVLQGSLPEGDQESLVVEFLAGGDPEAQVAELKDTMPEGRAIWFLVSNAESVERVEADLKQRGKEVTPQQREVWDAARPFYGIVNSHGLYVQGADHVVGPLADPAAGPSMLREGESYENLSELAEHLRTLR